LTPLYGWRAGRLRDGGGLGLDATAASSPGGAGFAAEAVGQVDGDDGDEDHQDVYGITLSLHLRSGTPQAEGKCL